VRNPDRHNFWDHRLKEGHTELDTKIGKLPCKGGWQFGDEKRCLPGTREDFLDYIVNWVENHESQRGLLLLGQAGTGKSSIAHEVAHRFENKRLGSFFAFVRNQGSKDEAYQLFTTLARDLSNRYPPFKHALGRVLKSDSSLLTTRHYRTLFERLILEPLKDLQFSHPILIVIDALDESGDATGKNGLHIFLAQRLLDLPSNFRVLITSWPENGIEPAFVNALSIYTLYMDDSQLAANTEQDICLYLQSELPSEVFDRYGVKLANAAEGLFQWAVVLCGLIKKSSS
jgi:AAA ATPase domain